MRGVIQKITVKKGNTNGKEWTLNRLKIDGEEYSKWGNCPFQVGDEVEFTWEKDGNFKKITSIKKANENGGSSNIEGSQLVLELMKKIDSKLSSFNSIFASFKLAIEIEEKGLDLDSVMDKARVIYLAMQGKKVELKNNKEGEEEKNEDSSDNS